MQIKMNKPTATERTANVSAGTLELEPIRAKTFAELRPQVKAAGFRPGKAPDNIVEKEINPQQIQAEFIEMAAREFFGQLIQKEKLRPLGNPHVEVKKFVPYSELELEFKFDVMPEIKLPDYKKIKKTRPEVTIEDTEIDSVIEGLRIRAAKRSEVKRAAKDGDEVIIDMVGYRSDSDQNQPVEVPGTKAQNYTVLLGSSRLVPGFEKELVGLNAGDKKDFTITFPPDYPEPTLQNKEVDFKVEIKKVQEVSKPAVDDKLAAEVGPFKNLDELKADVKKQLRTEKEQASERQLTDEIVEQIVDEAQFDLPARLINHQLEHLWQDLERNIKAQGQTMDEYLKQQQKSRTEMEELLKKEAARRIKTGLVIGQIAEAENIKVSPEELEIRMQILKGRYQDKQLQEQLDKPETKRDLADQLLLEKTVKKLVGHATS